ncbi:MAG: hypothetical protein Q9198_007817 [Flavoplaca austrocitrina]
MTAPSPSPQQNLQTLSEEYQKLQTDLQTQITSRQRLESQQQENLAVRKEFNTLSTESTIYKLIGPVLLKQEKAEAESAVDGRKRVEKLISNMQEQSEGKKMEIYQLQMKTQEAK